MLDATARANSGNTAPLTSPKRPGAGSTDITEPSTDASLVPSTLRAVTATRYDIPLCTPVNVQPDASAPAASQITSAPGANPPSGVATTRYPSTGEPPLSASGTAVQVTSISPIPASARTPPGAAGRSTAAIDNPLADASADGPVCAPAPAVNNTPVHSASKSVCRDPDRVTVNSVSLTRATAPISTPSGRLAAATLPSGTSACHSALSSVRVTTAPSSSCSRSVPDAVIAGAANTGPAGPLTRRSALPASSVNDATTRSRRPSCAPVNSKVSGVAPAMSVNPPPDPSSCCHCQARTALPRPSASAMSPRPAVSVSPTCALPVMAGDPAAGRFAAATGPMGALTRRSALPAPSVNDAATRTRRPSCASVNSIVSDVAPAMSANSPPDPPSCCHCQARTASPRPSASVMPPRSAVSVSPTCALPLISGDPAAARLTVTGPAGALARRSQLPAPSMNVATTRSRRPSCAPVNLKVSDIAPAMSANPPPEPPSCCHCQTRTAPPMPSSAAMSPRPAVSVLPTCATPVISGDPVAGRFAGDTGPTGALTRRSR